MDNIDPKQDRRVDRRTFLKGGLVAGGVLAGAGGTIAALAATSSDPDPHPKTASGSGTSSSPPLAARPADGVGIARTSS